MTPKPDHLLPLADWLNAEIELRGAGARIPTIREIMRRFRTSQRAVERALRPHIESGKLNVRRGQGIVVCDPAANRPTCEADILVLYRISHSRLARNLILELEKRMKATGVSIMLLGFSDEQQALSILSRLDRFKVCLLQGHFYALPLFFLTGISKRADAIVLDGISTTGLEMDGIGTNWREALSIAYRDLQNHGHERIAYLTSAHPARQIAMARREYLRLCQASGSLQSWLIELDQLPGSYTGADMAAAVARLRNPDGALAVTGLITWGVVDGYLLDRALREVGIMPGRDLSVIALGSVDFPSEHLNTFDTIGNGHAEKLDTFERVLRARLTPGGAAPEIHYLPIHTVQFGSVDHIDN